MVGRTASVISPFYSLLPDPGSLWGTPRQCTRSSLFIIFINDNYIAAGDIYILKKFPDDTKLGQVMCSEGDADTRDMKFINSKCKILHVGKNNPRFNFFMNGAQLSESEEEKDLWVLVNKSLKNLPACAQRLPEKQTLILDLFLVHFITGTDMLCQLVENLCSPSP